MFFVGLPASCDLENGTPAKVNGEQVVIRRDGHYLTYESDGQLNRCYIINEEKVERLPMPDGSMVKGIYYHCASDGQDPTECKVVKPAIVEPIGQMKPKVIDQRTMTRLLVEQDNWGYNRQLNEGCQYVLQRFKVIPTMEHHHKMGEPCEPHLRTVVTDTYNKMVLGFLDMPYETWNAI